MCPRCQSIEVIRWAKQKGIMPETGGRFFPEGNPNMSALVCANCGMMLYDDRCGWTTDIVAKSKEFTKLALNNGLTNPKQIADFLGEMGIPRAYTPEGVYYYD